MPTTPLAALHPLVERHTLPVSPVFLATAAVVLLVAVARWAPAPRTAAPADGRARGDGLDRRLSPWQLPARAAGLGLLALAVYAGRYGLDSRFDNVAPALVVGVAWPLVVLGALAGGRVWRHVDPWDSLGRLVAPLGADSGGEAGDVRWAVPFALAWGWYVAVLPTALSPRSVSAALAAYTVAMVAGCLAVGRVRWLSGAEAIGMFADWVARVRTGELVAWRPPAGAAAFLGVLGGGMAFDVLRRSDLWSDAVPAGQLVAWRSAGLVVCCAGAAAVLALAGRRAAGAVVAAAVPAVAGTALAAWLAEDRLWLAAQLLASAASDPLGRGWDLFGTAGRDLVGFPLGVSGRIVLQLAVLLTAHAWGVLVAKRRGAERAALLPLGVLLAGSVLAVSAT